MNTPETKPKPAWSGTAADAYKILCDILKKKPAAHKLIMAHLRKITGANAPLPVYHTTYCPECQGDKHCPKCDADRVTLYRLMVRAIMENNFTLLDGQVGNGDKETEAGRASVPASPVHEVAATQATTPEPPLSQPTQPAVTPAIVATEAEIPDPAPIVKLPKTSLRWHLDDIIRSIVRDEINKAQSPEPDRVALKSLVKECLNNGEFPEDRVRTIVRSTLREMFNPVTETKTTT